MSSRLKPILTTLCLTAPRKAQLHFFGLAAPVKSVREEVTWRRRGRDDHGSEGHDPYLVALAVVIAYCGADTFWPALRAFAEAGREPSG